MASSDTHITDFVTGRLVSNVGAEANRQQVERLLVESKGYAPAEITVDASIQVPVQGEIYASVVDLVVSVHGKPYMVIKCAPGSLASREREIIAAARLLEAYQIPLAIASDGLTAEVWDTVSGQHLGRGLEMIPTKAAAQAAFDPAALTPLDARRRERQALIFRSYDAMYVNR